MNIVKLYAIYDILAEKVIHCFLETNDKTAQRVFVEWYKTVPYPEDFELRVICDLDGAFIMIDDFEYDMKFIARGGKND